jgi:hypothetical protein
LNLGSTIGLGNECTIEMAEMEAGCPMYDCYKNDSVGHFQIMSSFYNWHFQTAELNVNGCSYVPNTLFNEVCISTLILSLQLLTICRLLVIYMISVTLLQALQRNCVMILLLKTSFSYTVTMLMFLKELLAGEELNWPEL